MLNYVVSVATYGCVPRMRHFMSSLLSTVEARENKDGNILKLLVLNTGPESRELNKLVADYFPSSRIDLVEKNRPYAEIIFEKIQMTLPFADDDTVYINFDDDYVMNPNWFKFLRRIYEENDCVEYLTLLKGYPGYEYQIDKLSGFDFCRVASAMGGSFSARWNVLYPAVTKFFESYGTGGMFDIEFWQMLNTKDRPYNIYMPLQASLIQHTNQVSNFLDMKRDRLEHQYGFDFDPAGNPFAWIGE